MLLGMSLHAFTLLHVILSLIGIGSGAIVVYGFLETRDFIPWTLLFLATTTATSLTGFLFPVPRLLPSHAVGIMSLAVLAGAIFTWNPVSGRRRKAFIVCALIAFYFNVFVLVAQLFKHVPSLHELAPTQSEPPFAVAQGLVAAGFVVLGILSLRRLRPIRTA
jgi:hypothetical protein